MKTSWLRIPQRLRALKQLRTVGQWWLFGRALVVAALVPVLFRCKLPTISRRLERRRCGRNPSANIGSILQCVELALSVASPLVRANCLTRAITLYYFLRPAGLNLSVCFGATLKDGQLQPGPGHCWLLKDGAPFLEPNDPSGRFLVLYTLPNPSTPPTSAAAC